MSFGYCALRGLSVLMALLAVNRAMFCDPDVTEDNHFSKLLVTKRYVVVAETFFDL